MSDNTFGVFQFSAWTLAIMAIVAASLVFLATVLYYVQDNGWIGFIPHFIGSTLLFILMASWWTSDVDWSGWGPFPVIGGLILVVAYIGIPLKIREDS